MTNKTISINPQLFSMGGSKTKKNREKKEKITVTPLISPNVLKNKLLKRIKEHKERETENLDNNKRKLTEQNKNDTLEKLNAINYADEFSESMSYLQTLSKQKKVDEEKANYERKKEQKLKQLQTQTIKNYASLQSSGGSPIINIDLPEELQAHQIAGSLDEIKSAFTNLVSNALRYTPSGGAVTVSCSHRNAHFEFSVKDTGFGISPEHLPRLTERFYRVDRSRSRDTGGTGLGLAIVKHVIQRHGGHLRIESKLNLGSCFTLEFPNSRFRRKSI
jgi:signal transduction histidine kinase